MKMYPYTCVVCNAGFLSLYIIVANPSCDPCSHLADMKTMARFGTDWKKMPGKLICDRSNFKCFKSNISKIAGVYRVFKPSTLIVGMSTIKCMQVFDTLL